jgi:nitroimidazol reductase NimA-like FMN-containing flavoprotein (pyridoxamine 5'-phosphate oxidase superfamily)
MMGNLNADEIETVLRSEVVGRIACVWEGWPYVIPVTYVYDGGEYVFSHSQDGQKIRAMRANPQVCFEVEQIRSPANWRTVIARGRFEELERDEGERAMEMITGKFAWCRPDGEPQDRHEAAHRRAGVVRPVLYRIRLLERTGRFELS